MLPLTDRLAVTRTALANERTLLAYARTALALSGGGLGLLEFTDTPRLIALGALLLPTGLLVLAFGVLRFRRTRRTLRQAAPPVE